MFVNEQQYPVKATAIIDQSSKRGTHSTISQPISLICQGLKYYYLIFLVNNLGSLGTPEDHCYWVSTINEEGFQFRKAITKMQMLALFKCSLFLELQKLMRFYQYLLPHQLSSQVKSYIAIGVCSFCETFMFECDTLHIQLQLSTL